MKPSKRNTYSSRKLSALAFCFCLAGLGLVQAQTPQDAHWYFDYGGPSGDPFAMAEVGQHIYMAGGFLNVAGSGALKNLARFNRNTETWEQVPGIDASHSNFIRTLFADDQGNLFVGGDFTRIGGIEADRIAMFDTFLGTWSALRDGSNSGPDSGGVYAVARAGDYVYIGGFIFNGDPSQKYIRRYNLTTKQWEAVGNGLNDRVRALAVDAEGVLHAGGAFDGGVAKWTGSTWETVSNGVDGIVRSLAFGPNNELYAGGDFTTAGSQGASMVACYANGQWNNLDGGLKGGGHVAGVWGMTVDAKGRLFVSGDFDFSVNGDQPMNKVAMYDGAKWRSLGSGLGNSTSQIVNTTLAIGNDVYFGGVFAAPFGSANAKKNFARWNDELDFTDYLPVSTGGVVLQDTTREPVVADQHWFLDYGGPSGDPFALVPNGDYIYMAGAFLNTAGDGNLKNLARFHVNWERWEQVPGIDGTHANFIRDIFSDDEGKLWVSGDFSRIGGTDADRVAKFDPKTSTWSPLRDAGALTDKLGPTSGGAYAVVKSGDYVYIGGFVFNSDDPKMRFIRRFNVTTSTWETVGAGLNNAVRALALDANGNVYAGGSFTGTADGSSAMNGLAMWDGSRWSEVGGGVDGAVRALTFAESGTLYVGGQFTNAGGTAANNIAAWDGVFWNSMDGGVQGGGDVNGVYGISVDAEGRVYIAGDFERSTADETRLNKVAVYGDAGVWQPLGSGLGNSTSQIVNTVTTIGTDAFFGGVFADANGSPNKKKNFARWNPDVDFRDHVASVNAPPRPQDPPKGPKPDELAEANKHMFLEYGGPDGGDPFAMVRHGQYIYTAGAFQRITNKSGIKTLARFNLETEQWETLPGLDGSQGWVRSLDIDHEGNLWVGGDFSSIGGVSARRIAKFNTATGQWSPLRDRNHPDEFGPVSGGAYATVRSGNYVYIGGFIFNSDNPAERYVRRFNLTTNTWETAGNGLNGRVNAMVVDANGHVIAGGSFTGSGTTPISSLAKWDGEKWLPVGGGIDGVVRTMKIDVDGTLYVGGDFIQAGSTQVNMVAAWDGEKWDDFNLGLAGGGSVKGIWGLDLDEDGRLYVGGDFDESWIDGTPLNKVAVYDASGTWQPLGHGVGNSSTQIVTSVMADGNDVFFAGLFADPNGSPNRKKNFARWNPNLDFTGYEPAQNVEPPVDPSGPQRPDDDKHWFYDYGGPSGDPFGMAKLGNYIYMAGGFLSNAGDPEMKNLARFNVNTLKWERVPGITSLHRNFIRALHADDEGNLWVGGDFSSIAGIEAKRIAKFNPVTEEWSALSDPSAGDDANGPVSGGVYSVVRSGDYVYIGGFVFNHNDPSKRFVRRFNVRTNKWESAGDGLNAKVSALAVASNGDVYAGGIFTHSGSTPVQSFARFDGQKWNEVGGGVNGVVRTISIAPNGIVYIGGQFDQVGGLLANNVASWDGVFWNAMAGGVIGGGSVNGVYGMSIDGNGRVYIGGDFDFADSDLHPLNKVAIWDGSGSWEPAGSGLGNTSTQIVNVVLADGNDVYMAGVFADPFGPPNRKKNFARWNPTLNLSGDTGVVVPKIERPLAGLQLVGNELRVSFQSKPDATYRLQVSADMRTWTTIGDVINGDGQGWMWTLTKNVDENYFRVTEER